MIKTKNLIMLLTIIMLVIVGTLVISADNVQVELSEENFPDDVFREYIIETCDTNDDGVLGYLELVYADYIDICGLDIKTLQGIEYLTNMTILYISDVPITELDITNNTKLTSLSISDATLTELDVTYNTELTNLSLYNVPITELDVINNAELTYLDLSYIPLSSLDVTNNTKLVGLTVYFADIEELNVTNNTELISLCPYDTPLTSLDVTNNTKLTYLNISDTLITGIDLSKNTELLTLQSYDAPLAELDVTKNTLLQSLECNGVDITELDLSMNTELTNLDCSNTQITELDVTNNTKLVNLMCAITAITELDVTQNTVLEQLYLFRSGLDELDLRCNPELWEINLMYSAVGKIYMYDTTLDVTFNRDVLTADIFYDVPNNTWGAMEIYDEITTETDIRWNPVDYTIEFIVNGETISSQLCEEYTDIEIPDDPETYTVDGYDYTFTGWSPEVSETALGDVIYTAQFDKTESKVESETHTITFLDEDGSVLSSTEYGYGEEVVLPAEPTKESTAEYTYEFIGWTPEVSNLALQNVTYTAQYKKEKVEEQLYTHTITFVGLDEYLYQCVYEHGAEVIQPDVVDTKVEDGFVYNFIGWSPEVEVATEDITYCAIYEVSLDIYTITFLDDDGSILDSTVYGYGEEVVLPAEPTKESTAEYTYEFVGWSPEITTVTGEASYTAIYNATKNKYTVTFLDDDGSVLNSTEYEYGDIVEEFSVTDKELSQETTYKFIEWTPAIDSVVTEEAEYTAVYELLKVEDSTQDEPDEEPKEEPKEELEEEPKEEPDKEDKPEDTEVEDKEESNDSQTIQTGDTNLTFILLGSLIFMWGMAVTSFMLYEESVTK